jgi:hypothetical protein
MALFSVEVKAVGTSTISHQPLCRRRAPRSGRQEYAAHGSSVKKTVYSFQRHQSLQAWFRAFAKTTQEVDRTGCLPDEHSAHGPEAACGKWIGRQRRLFEAADPKLESWMIVLLNAKVPGWDAKRRELIWEARMSDVLAFRDKHGRLPAEDSTDPVEQTLGAWLAKQCDNHLPNPDLNKQRRDRLDEIVPGWTDRIDKTNWRATAAAAAARVTERGSFPNRRSADPVERTDGLWLHNQRNRLDPENPKHAGRIATLDALMPRWR